MDDLKQKIMEIKNVAQSNRHFNKCEALVQVALDRGELDKLFSGDPSYIYDDEGVAWLAINPQLGKTSEPFSVISVYAAFENVYLSARTKDRKEKTFYAENIKEVFVESFKKMVAGTPEQLYWATQIFAHLSVSISERNSAFYSYVKKEQFNDELRPYLTSAITTTDIDLKNVHIYDCEDLEFGLWQYCLEYSKKLESLGCHGFITE